MKIEIYTDGSADNIGSKCGGWAFAVYLDNKLMHQVSGADCNTTNNRMELVAMLNAAGNFGGEDVIIYTDSAYIVRCFEEKWYEKWEKNGWKNSKSQPVANRDLWEDLIHFYRTFNFTIKKVKGHESCEGNILADKLAVEARRKLENEICNN